MPSTEISDYCEAQGVTIHHENSTASIMLSEGGPNWWWKYRSVRCLIYRWPRANTLISQMSRELVAEFAGVMILIILGAGVDCQVVLSTNTGVAPGQKGVSDIFNND